MAEINTVVQAQEVGPYVDTHFLLWQTSANGIDGWMTWSEQPIVGDPQPEAFPAEEGSFVRAAITTGDSVPITEWSNVVQVLA